MGEILSEEMKAQIRWFLEPEMRDLVRRIFNEEIVPRLENYINNKIYQLSNSLANRSQPKYKVGQRVWAGAGVQNYVIIENVYFSIDNNCWVYQFHGPDSFGSYGYYDYFTEEYLFERSPE